MATLPILRAALQRVDKVTTHSTLCEAGAALIWALSCGLYRVFQSTHTAVRGVEGEAPHSLYSETPGTCLSLTSSG